MKKRFAALLLTCAMAVSICACGAPAATNDAPGGSAASDGGEQWERRTIRIGHDNSASHAAHRACEQLAEKIAEATGGAVTIEIYPSGTLGSSSDMVSQIVQGTLDATFTGTAALSEYDPLMNVVDVPYLKDTVEEYQEMYNGPFGDAVAEIIEKGCNAVMVDFLSIGGFRHMTNNVRPIITPDDLKGLKIRIASSDIRGKFFDECGASGISMTFSEVFTALQQGTIDGQENPLATIQMNKLSEVQKYLSLTGHIYSAYAFMFSAVKWNEYQPELQELLMTYGKEVGQWERQQILVEEDALLQELKEEGMEVNEVDLAAFRERAGAVWAYFIQTYGDAGRELLDLAEVDYEKYL
ncbi:TRAP transporter substrate-binding protein [uncultured Oscillibacter sp.]|uniref:TRAP transporter substrate-binding protein n=1 Tax=uncultured Oscillibacter sp. TaxID=876091 RepID=UPI0025DA7B44|nr:TRAP transporter substrate-binding protein [uncultured Oscillibacter sp.]